MSFWNFSQSLKPTDLNAAAVYKFMADIPFKSKDRIEYPEVLFLQIDRVGKCSVECPERLPVAVDILAAMVAFKGKINYEANEYDTPEEKYKKTIRAFEDIISLLDVHDLLFRYKRQSSVGGQEEEDGGKSG
jgi:hypothetical protein